MKMGVYSVFDKATGAFLPPFFVRSKGEAIRSFSEACSNDGHQFAKHMLDYTLFDLGSFDDNSGVIAGTEPVRVISALEVRGDDPAPSVTPS
jgi:hypothetical protein